MMADGVREVADGTGSGISSSTWCARFSVLDPDLGAGRGYGSGFGLRWTGLLLGLRNWTGLRFFSFIFFLFFFLIKLINFN